MTDQPVPRSDIDLELARAVRRVRRRWKIRVLVEGAARVAVAALLALLAGAALTALFGAGSATVVTMRVLGYLLIAAALLRYLVLPAFRTPDDTRLALYIEERAPELRQALVSAVHELRTEPAARPSPVLGGLIVAHALGELRRLEAGPGVERPLLLRAAGMLGGAAAAAALLLGVGPAILRDTARVLFIPWAEAEAAPLFAIQVVPGDAAVPRGGAVDIRAALRGFAAQSAELVLKTDTASEWVRLPMARDSLQAEFTSRLFDLTRATEYYVEAEGVRSRGFRLSVTDLPAVSRIALDLRFPAYTNLPPDHLDPGGDVAAMVGTTVTVHATVTRDIRSGALRLDGNRAVPLSRDADGRWSAAFRVARDGFYRIDLVSADGTPVPGSVQYVIEALDDRSPTVAIEQPGRDVKATSVEEITIATRASDDYGVQRLELAYSVNGGPEQRVALADSTSARAATEVRAAHTLFLEELGLKPGDLISYHAVARDGAGNSGSSDIYFLEIRPFGKDYRQADAGGGGGGGGGGQSPDGLSVRQREIVAGTFNWLRDSAATADKQRGEDLTTLAISQGRLREDAAGLVRRLVQRNIIAADSMFRVVHAELDTAVREMGAAEESLGKGLGRDALPAEERALQHVQRAEAAYREVEVQLGGGGGGGGGGGASRAEDLADLFELETDKLRNQYESVRRDQEQGARQELDATAERLRQLASRQQQENERMQRMSEALRDRLPPGGGGGAGGGASSGASSSGGASGGSGSGGAQRELARQAEEEARRLERLAREQNAPELAQAARNLRDAAEAMRRAASGANGQGQGTSALDRLRNAAKDLENARTSGMQAGIRDLARQAQELSARQREIAGAAGQLGSASGADRGERLNRLDERKDALAGDVQQLEAEADRLSREARREQPGAATKLGEAAQTIRDARIRDKILYSKSVIRTPSPDFIKRLEDGIASNLGDVSERLREAAAAVTESADSRRDRALERARELVRGLESLRDRMGDRLDPTRAGAASPGGGQPGGQQSGQPGGQQSGRDGAQQGGRQAGGQQGGQQGAQQGAQSGGQDAQGGQGGQGGQRRQGGDVRGAPGFGPPGGGSLSPGEARQFSREFRLRREAAESLRRDLAGQGGEVRDLDRAIEDLRRLENARAGGDPRGILELQQAVIEGLKTWEFKLWRALAQTGDQGPALGAPSQAPAEYRALVEEYYRALARGKRP